MNGSLGSDQEVLSVVGFCRLYLPFQVKRYLGELRLISPEQVKAVPMLAIAATGFVVNAGAFFLLHGADRDNLNIKGALLHVVGDLLASLAARTDTYWIGNSGNPHTEYIVFDGKNSGYGSGAVNVPALINQFYPGHIYTQIYADDDVYVYRLSAQSPPMR